MTPHPHPVRAPAVAGIFYPGSAGPLSALVARLLAGAAGTTPTEPSATECKAVIVPHAGYEYSGPIAASAYVRLRPLRDKVRRVVLLGPSHRLWFRGLALPGAGAFRTPLGDVQLDDAAIADLPQIPVVPEAHAREHSLEVQLPFLQRVLGDFRLVPLVVGDATPAEVAGVLDLLWDETETLIVVSSDLSHYESYERARRHDADTAAAIERGDASSLGPDDACGCIGISALLLVARRRSLACNRLDLRNSGDTAGDRANVVGYGAWAFASSF